MPQPFLAGRPRVCGPMFAILCGGHTLARQALTSRHMNATKMNSQSSRSHAVFVFGVGTALLFVIDAGGTERVHKSEAEGTQYVTGRPAPQLLPMSRLPATLCFVQSPWLSAPTSLLPFPTGSRSPCPSISPCLQCVVSSKLCGSTKATPHCSKLFPTAATN